MLVIYIADWLWTARAVATGVLCPVVLVQFLGSVTEHTTDHTVVGQISEGRLHLLKHVPLSGFDAPQCG